MCLLGIVERPGVSWGVLGCPGVIRLTLGKSVPSRFGDIVWPDTQQIMFTIESI